MIVSGTRPIKRRRKSGGAGVAAALQLGFATSLALLVVGLPLAWNAVVAAKWAAHREKIAARIKVAPLAYLRGRTFHNSIMVFDEAQNATFGQLKLFLTRIGSGSQVIVTGDADQSDLPRQERRLVDVMQRLSGIKGVGVVEFKASDIVRNPIIEGVLRELER